MAIRRYLFLIVVCYLTVTTFTVKISFAQESQDAYDAAPVFVTPHPAQSEADAQTVDIPAPSSIELDELDSLLPAHLRKPLPLPGDAFPPQQNVDEDDQTKITKNKQPPSPVEAFYRRAASDETLAQFGYDFIGSVTGMSSVAPAAGAVADNYILGAGDQLTIAFMGERKDHGSYTVDRAGTLGIDHLPPLAVAGKTLAQARADINKLLQAQSYHGDVFVSLEHVRQIGVLVAGHVKNPGRRLLTPLQTPVEALIESDGITKTGSLRQIRLIRAGDTHIIDLYPVMGAADNTQHMPTLQDGDRIIVPPLGPTLAIAGDVRQPGIYELSADNVMNVDQAIALAGGFMAQGQNRVAVLSPQQNGNRVAQMVAPGSKQILNDGTILSVTRTIDRNAASFTLFGETREAGTYGLAQYPKLSKLLHSPQAFGDDVYPLFGVMSRRRATDLARDLLAFSPQDIFMGRGDVTLQDGDSVQLFSRDDIRSVMKGRTTNLEPLIVTFIEEHDVSLQGAVRLPGSWPVAGPVSIARILDVAGGSLSDADLSRVEINRNDVGLMEVSTGAVSHRDVVDISDAGAESVTVTFGDAVRIPDRFEAVTRQSIRLEGEVRNPGTYDLMRGDTLLTLIDRAGGLTDQAYPAGAVFSRASERKREKDKFNIAARDLERSIAVAAQDKDGKVNMEQMALAKDLVEELKTVDPVGRITVESDPGILRRDPAQNILMESGDRVYIPKRPLTVRVTGEVLSPAALQFRDDKTSRDYLSEAGGTTMNADVGRAFILFPNGSAQPLNKTTWTAIKPMMITPGSTIVVPRDPKPFDFMESAKDITQILSNIAISGIYADDLINRDD